MGIVVEVIGELENFHMSREELEVSVRPVLFDVFVIHFTLLLFSGN